MSDYEINVMLEIEARRYKKRYNTNKVLVTAHAWVENAYGSAECSHGSWELAVEAYAEYRSTQEWN